MRANITPAVRLRSIALRALALACVAFAASCAAPPPKPPGSRVVAATGEGATREEAMAAARRDAVRQVAGEFMKSRTVVADDRIEQDRVVAMSDGYVLSTEVLREERLPDGTVRVRIAAQVVDERMQEPGATARSAPVMADRSGEAPSRAERERDSAAMLAAVLEETDYPIGVFDAVPSRPELQAAGGVQRLSWTVTLRANPLRWRRFLDGSGHALAALGAADAVVPWQPRAAGARVRDLERTPSVVGAFMGAPLRARLTEASAPFLPGPRDNTVAPAEPGARDRTVLFVESSEVAARSFTLAPAGFATLAGTLARAATARPVLRTRLLDADGAEVLTASTALDMNLSTCVLLLAEMRGGVPAAIPAGSGRLADGRPMTELRPMMLVPAIGVDGVLLREVALDCTAAVAAELAARVDRVECSLGWR